MLSTQDNRLKSLQYQYPESIPLSAGILPAAWIKYRHDLEAIVRRHPLVFGVQGDLPRDYDAITSKTYHEGEHVDVWGCVWSNLKDGQESIVTGHPVPTRESVRSLQIPTPDDMMPHGFMYLRLADLRGFDQLMIDFAEEAPELQMLLDKVLEYNLRQVKLRIDNMSIPGQIVYLGDDLGMQRSLAISPSQWRKYLKPCFARIFKPIKDTGHYVYLHTDGHILPIIQDLIECGVDVLNPQIGANGLAGLVKTCKGKVCVDLDLDRQKFPFWTPAEIDAHIREAVDALGDPSGGLWLKAEIGDDVPLENVEAICQAMEKYSLLRV
jgi:hypothetical protein